MGYGAEGRVWTAGWRPSSAPAAVIIEAVGPPADLQALLDFLDSVVSEGTVVVDDV
jgi:hypothetical protein